MFSAPIKHGRHHELLRWKRRLNSQRDPALKMSQTCGKIQVETFECEEIPGILCTVSDYQLGSIQHTTVL